MGFLVRLVMFGLGLTLGAAEAYARPNLSLPTRDFRYRFYFPQADLNPTQDFENLWFGEDKVVLNTMSLGTAPESNLSHELTVFAPVTSTSDDNDWLGTVRSILYAQTDSRRPVSFSFRHGVWSNFYRNSGYYVESGARSYRALKHQIRIAAEAKIVRNQLTLFFPIYLQQAHFADFKPRARWNGHWRYAAWVAPELIYQNGDKWAVSIFYETDTLVGSYLQRFYFLESIAEGEVGLRFTYRI